MPLRLNHSLIPALKICSLVLAATAATTVCVRAGTDDTSKDLNKNVIEKPATEPRFYVEIGAAGEFDYHATKFISNGTANFGSPVFSIANPPTVPIVAARHENTISNPALPYLPASIQSRDFTSAHDVAAVDGRFNFGYIINPLVSVYAGFTYTHDDGEHSRRLGSVQDATGTFGPAGANYDLYGDVGQYQSYAGIGGVKFTLPRTVLDLIHAPKFIRPYFDLSAGAKYIQSQHIRFTSGGGLDAVDTTIKLYDPSVVFTGQGGFGYELKFTRNFSVNIDTDYGYDTKPQRPDNSTGFSGINRSGDRFYETVGLSAVFKF